MEKAHQSLISDKHGIITCATEMQFIVYHTCQQETQEFGSSKVCVFLSFQWGFCWFGVFSKC